MNWRAELRAAGVERRPSNDADRGYVEQPGEGLTGDKPPASVPRLPPHSQRPPSGRDTRISPYVPPPIEREETRQIREALNHLASLPDPLPPPSAEPTKPPEQTLVRLVRPMEQQEDAPRQACGKRARRCHAFPDDFKAKVLARLSELHAQPRRRGEGVRTHIVAREFDISSSIVHRWLRLERGKADVANTSKRLVGRQWPFSQEERDEWARKAIAFGRGGGPMMAKKAKVPLGTIHGWVNSYRARNPDAPAPYSTLVSSGPVSKPAASKPNGASAPLSGFLTGLDDYIAQLVDARVEAKLIEILKTKSLMDLMK